MENFLVKKLEFQLKNYYIKDTKTSYPKWLDQSIISEIKERNNINIIQILSENKEDTLPNSFYELPFCISQN